MNPRQLFVILLLIQGAARAIAAPPIDPAEGRPHILWQEARPYVGQVAYVSGKVIGVSSAGKITFINFDSERPRRFTGVIHGDKLTNFPKPPKEMYDGKIVSIRGTVSLFQDQPQIVISSPDQINILDKLPAPSPPKHGTAGPAKPGELRIAAYNILNLFDEHDDPYREDEDTEPKPRKQMENVAQSIRAINPDVIAMEEVENRDYLQRFISVFLSDMGYEHVVLFEGNDTRGIDVALVSRVPVGAVRSHRHLRFEGHDGNPARFQRDALAVTILPPDAEPIDVWVLHLKSNSGGRETTEPIRVAEAQQVRKLLDAELAENSEARFLVMGDLNDTPETKTISTIVGAQSGALFSVGTDLGDPSAVTYNAGDFRSVIDYILCSPAMARAYVKGSVQVPQGSIETTGSDHNPIVATFKLK